MTFDYEHLTDEGILRKFLKSQFIKGMKKEYGEIPESRYHLILKVIKHLLTVDYEIKRCWYIAAYRLLIYADDNEILECLDYVSQLKKSNTSLLNLTMTYGKTEGNKRYENNVKGISDRNDGKLWQSNEYLAKKHDISIEEVVQLKKDIRKKALSTCIVKYGENYHRRRSVLCPEYYLEKGYTNLEEIYLLIKIQTDKVKMNRESYISKYGEIEGNARFEKILFNRKETVKYRIDNDLPPDKRHLKGNASKESMIFFDKLLNLFDINGISIERELIHYGKTGYNSERWVRDGDSIYFIDFFINKYGIAVEYDGSAYHCVDPNNWPEKHGLLKKDNLHYYNYDQSKKKCIRENSNLFIIVRSESANLLEIFLKISSFMKEYDDRSKETEIPLCESLNDN